MTTASIVGRQIGLWFFVALPLLLFVALLSLLPTVAGGEALTLDIAWVDLLDVSFAISVDGLSLLFALLVTGVGFTVMLFARSYLAEDPLILRFFLILSVFMVAMLGLVLADQLLLLFIFWELTSISSYLLIGFKHQYQASRSAALQALLVTGVGGLSLLAGLVLLGIGTGEWRLTSLLANPEGLLSSSYFVPALLLILLGAFTKSAQFPFHFWLPGAMAAPAPVSAYLHSATMVKAGIYLLARLSPVFADTVLWQSILIPIGAATMLVGAILAVQQTDLKRILAYTTISVLGILTLLLGLGEPLAIKAMLVVLIAHALYKGSLFMIAGTLENVTGSRDIRELSGLWRAVPLLAFAAGLAGLSKIGFIPMLGFIGKEVFYEATMGTSLNSTLITALSFITNSLLVLSTGLVVMRVFFSKSRHNLPISQVSTLLWFAPLSLALLGALLGLVPSALSTYFVSPASSSILGASTTADLYLWKGFNLVLLLSVLTILFGAALYTQREPIRKLAQVINVGTSIGPERVYAWALNALQRLANAQTRVLQGGYLPLYLLVIITTAIVLAGRSLLGANLAELTRGWAQFRLYELLVVLIIPIAAFAAIRTRSRLFAVAALGAVGFSVAMIFLLFGAPDLAMTQFAVETLIVILFAFVLYRLPRFSNLTSRAAKWRDAIVATSAGSLIFVMVLSIITSPLESRLSPYFIENSVPLARGRNIVNTILVDFRSLDTLGEIVVLGAAAIGIYALMRWIPQPKTDQETVVEEK